MNIKKYIFCIMLLLTQSISHIMQTKEFIYPIIQIDDEKILLMHQHSIDDLELLLWNQSTRIAQKELTSVYIPSFVQLLPSKTAYSFLDRGRLHIKNFQKRAPRSIDMYEPICDIQSMCWISDEQCIFVALHKNIRKIFMYDIGVPGGMLYFITPRYDLVNYTSPNKIGSELFCLAQSSKGHYNIVEMLYSPVSYNLDQDQESIICKVTHLAGSHHPLCFLTMMDATSGFVLQLIEQDDDQHTLTFVCNQVGVVQDQAALTPLFRFTLPESLILGSGFERLYESIYPVLPRYDTLKIYFTHYQNGQCLAYEFDKMTHEIQPSFLPTKSTHFEHIFSPLIVGKNLYFGCSILPQNRSKNILVTNPINGFIACDLPHKMSH